jgi:DNA ligase 1
MFRPLLAPREDPLSYPGYFRELRYPLLCSPKYDGIRCLTFDGTCYSRTMKPLPSLQVQEEFCHFHNFDGELLVGNPTDFGVYNRTQSHVMSADKPGEVKYYVFDYLADLAMPFLERNFEVESLCKGQENVVHVPQTLIETESELLEYEYFCLAEGYEGIIMRDPHGHYKCNRGTFREGLIYKLKRFEDAEGVVVDFSEQMNNNNELETDERGYAKRSHVKENKEPGGMVGNFIVDYNGELLDVAPGSFTQEQKKEIWEHQDHYLGSIIKFRFMRHGMKNVPRFCRALGFRNDL